MLNTIFLFCIQGGTRARKLVMLNQLVGGKIFPTNNIAHIATICSLRHSKEMSIHTYTKRRNLLEVQPIENIEQMKSAIKRLTNNSKAECDIEHTVFHLDVYLPVHILKVDMIFLSLIFFFKLNSLTNSYIFIMIIIGSVI